MKNQSKTSEHVRGKPKLHDDALRRVTRMAPNMCRLAPGLTVSRSEVGAIDNGAEPFELFWLSLPGADGH